MLTPNDILTQMEVGDKQPIYILGSTERRVTFRAQQTRALNLVFALTHQRRIKPDDKVLVIGAGLAGLTAAAAFLRSGCKVVLVERSDGPLHLQRGCKHRWVDPSIYDWPDNQASGPLPVLNWTADWAGSVADAVLGQWSQFEKDYSQALAKIYNAKDIAFIPGLNKVKVQARTVGYHEYKVAVLAIGFGEERHHFAETIPPRYYWKDDSLHQSFSGDKPRRILISGAGDGGLTDLLRATIKDFRHDLIATDFLHGVERDRVEASIKEIERRISASEGELTSDKLSEFICGEYAGIEAENCDKAIKARLRTDTAVTFNHNTVFPLTSNASALNRFLVSRILFNVGGVEDWDGEVIGAEKVATGYRIRVRKNSDNREVVREFDEVIFRHGPEPALALYFPDLARRFAAKTELVRLLDQTRRPLWPAGWLSAAQGESNAVPPAAAAPASWGAAARPNHSPDSGMEVTGPAVQRLADALQTGMRLLSQARRPRLEPDAPGTTKVDYLKEFKVIASEHAQPIAFWCGAGFTARDTPFWAQIDVQSRHVDSLAVQSILEQIVEEENRSDTTLFAKLWKLKISGLVTASVGNIAGREFAQQNRDNVYEFSSVEAAQHIHLLQRPKPFIMHLHGTIKNPNTLLFSPEAISSWAQTSGIKSFFQSALTSRVFCFAGLTEYDIATIECILGRDFDFATYGSHYYVDTEGTERSPPLKGLRRVPWPKSISAFLSELAVHQSFYDEPKPVVSRRFWGATGISMVPPEELARDEPEQIRQQLNAAAAAILKPETKDAYTQYTEFCREYWRPIHYSYAISTRPPDNQLLGYHIDSEIGGGAFGKVYLAHDDRGTQVAIKVLKEEIRDVKGSIRFFRRGTNSMRILSENQIQGTVRFIDAFEIPTCIVMEYVPGLDLLQAIKKGYIKGWNSILDIAVRICNIIQAAHATPERVLHRDIRPPNIMLRNFYLPKDDYEVVVLDFDLSWHKGALQGSVSFTGEKHGYLAPEQLRDIEGLPARNATVDSFGLGMTLLFMATGHDPMPNEQLTRNWEQVIRNRILSATPPLGWRSLPARFARLIADATRDEPLDRWTLMQISSDLQLMQQAAQGNCSSAELWAEELLWRCKPECQYTYSHEGFVHHTASHVRVVLCGNEVEDTIYLTLDWSAQGYEDRTTLVKFITERAPAVRSLLADGGWQVVDVNQSARELRIIAQVTVSIMPKSIEQVSRALSRALDRMSFA